MFRLKPLTRCARFASTLAFVEHRSSQVVPGSLNALTAAKLLGHPVTAVLVGGQSAAGAAVHVAKLDGIDKVLLFDGSEHSVSEPIASLLADTVKKHTFTHLIAASTAVGKDIVPRVGGLLDTQPITDIVAVNSDSEFVRPIYAGNALETVKTEQPIKLITVRTSAFPALDKTSSEAPTESSGEPAFSGAKAEFVKEELMQSKRPELASAAKVVSGGRGLKSKEEFERVIFPLADKLGAAVGASRAAVDSGFCDNSLQVGQTGKVVAPEFYIAVGISGAIQHLAGMKDAKVIACIDKNEDAPIFQVADIGLVGDLFQVVPEITNKI